MIRSLGYPCESCRVISWFMNTVHRSEFGRGSTPMTALLISSRLMPSVFACSSMKEPVPAAQT